MSCFGFLIEQVALQAPSDRLVSCDTGAEFLARVETASP